VVRIGAESKARGRDRDRQAVEALALALQVLAFVHHFVAGGVRCFRAAQWVAIRDPICPGFSLRAPHAPPSRSRVRGDCADHDRDVVLRAAAVDDIRKQENAFLSPSSIPPTNCQRTSGCSSESLVDRPGYRE